MSECRICEILEKKQAKILYEDEAVIVVLADEPTIFGHVWIIPKKHVRTLEELDDKTTQQLFYVASYTASALFEGLGAEGTNIIICNGNNSNQKFPHLIVDVLPRKNNDGIDTKWEPKRPDEEQMKETMKKIKDKTDMIGHTPEPIPQIKPPGEEDKEEMDYEEENYLVRQLTKIP